MGRSGKFFARFSPSPYPSPSREREPIEHIVMPDAGFLPLPVGEGRGKGIRLTL